MKKSKAKQLQELRIPPESAEEIAKLLRKNRKKFRYAYPSPETARELAKLSAGDRKMILEANLSNGPVKTELKGKKKSSKAKD